MASRGTALSRAVKYFEDADLREARVAFQLVQETMKERMDVATIAKSIGKPARKPRAKKTGTTAEVKQGESLASA